MKETGFCRVNLKLPSSTETVICQVWQRLLALFTIRVPIEACSILQTTSVSLPAWLFSLATGAHGAYAWVRGRFGELMLLDKLSVTQEIRLNSSSPSDDTTLRYALHLFLETSYPLIHPVLASFPHFTPCHAYPPFHSNCCLRV